MLRERSERIECGGRGQDMTYTTRSQLNARLEHPRSPEWLTDVMFGQAQNFLDYDDYKVWVKHEATYFDQVMQWCMFPERYT
jgi:hypothetical protein